MIMNAPDIFAEIQHQLGRVYAEIPDEVKKKGIWAAVSVSSFTEALNFYNKISKILLQEKEMPIQI